MIMGVLAMTPEQINMLPPADRANILQLVRLVIFANVFLTRLFSEQPSVSRRHNFYFIPDVYARYII
jgi:hypothetical protein